MVTIIGSDRAVQSATPSNSALQPALGEKTEAVLAAVDRQIATFRVADLQTECPGVGLEGRGEE